MTRTDLASATLQVVETIQNGEEYTLKEISEKTELNFRTVKKAIVLLEECQKQLESKKIHITRFAHTTRIQMKSKHGLLSMPINIQKMLIRTSYYPTPDRDEELLVYLLRHGATNHTSAIKITSSKILDKLVTAEHIIKKGTKYHLSDMGMITAQGAISLYPELVQ